MNSFGFLKSILNDSCFLSKDCLSLSSSVSSVVAGVFASSSMIAKMPAEVVAEGVVKVEW